MQWFFGLAGQLPDHRSGELGTATGEPLHLGVLRRAHPSLQIQGPTTRPGRYRNQQKTGPLQAIKHFCTILINTHKAIALPNPGFSSTHSIRNAPAQVLCLVQHPPAGALRIESFALSVDVPVNTTCSSMFLGAASPIGMMPS